MLAIVLCLTACVPEVEEIEEVEGVEEEPGKIAIFTLGLEITEDEFRSAEELVQKYPDRIIHKYWPGTEAGYVEEPMVTL